MNRVLIFAYVFVSFMAVICTILLYLLTKNPQPQQMSEYQLTIEDDHIIVEDAGRTVTILPLDSTCTLGSILIDDNQ